MKKSVNIMVKLFASITLSLLVGCASMSNGIMQPVLVDTGSNSSTCMLTNNKGSWSISATPGTVLVHRSDSNLAVSCKNTSGLSGVVSVPAKTNKKHSFMHGGLIAVAYDTNTGAVYDYPSLVEVPLK